MKAKLRTYMKFDSYDDKTIEIAPRFKKLKVGDNQELFINLSELELELKKQKIIIIKS